MNVVVGGGGGGAAFDPQGTITFSTRIMPHGVIYRQQ